MMKKRVIEVFTAGCTVCQPAVEMVKTMADPSWEVVVYDLSKASDSEAFVNKVKVYGIESLPAVAVNGVLLDCCRNKAIAKDNLMKSAMAEPVLF